MNSVRELLSNDHQRLDGLLGASLRDGRIDDAAYGEFRRGLLRHIGIEERLLFPAIRRSSGVTPLERTLHRDHAALAALLVPPPAAAEIEQIRAILAEHNPLEEDASGLYDLVDRLPHDELEPLIARVRGYPEVPVAPYADSATLRRSIEQLLRERRSE